MSWPVALDNVKCFHWPECSHNISSTSKLSNFGPQSHHLSLCKCEEKDIKKSLIICGEKICQPAFKCIFRVDNLFLNEILFPRIFLLTLLFVLLNYLHFKKRGRNGVIKGITLQNYTEYFLFWSISWRFFWPDQILAFLQHWWALSTVTPKMLWLYSLQRVNAFKITKEI
mgnify:CR=1 FL=1